MSTDSDATVSRRRLLAAVGAAGAAGVAGCTQNTGGSGEESLSGQINMSGSSTVYPLATAVGELFTDEYPEVNFNPQSTGSGGGFQNFFCTGETDFNNASRPIQPEEEQLCADNGVEPIELQVATDALTVIVNPNNDWASELTVEELNQLWSAETQPQQWSDVNSDWPDEDIELFGPSDASGTYDYFIEEVIGEEGSHRQDYSSTEQDRQIISGVEDSEYAIGYLGFAYYTQNSERVQAVAIDNGDGAVEPSIDTARSGEYQPLSRPLFTYPARGSLSEDQIAEFARFFIEQTTDEQLVAEDVGYVPLTEDQQSAQQETLEAAIEEATN